MAGFGAALTVVPAAAAPRRATAPQGDQLVLDRTVVVGRHPIGVDLDARDAVVANRDAGSVSIVPLGGGPVTEIAVGLHPVAVSIHLTGRQALVANAASHTVAVVDLASRSVTRTIRVGRRPVAVAAHPGRPLALVANQASDTVSVLDLVTGTETAAVPVGRRPSGVAINPATGLAAVANRGDDTVTLLGIAGAPRVVSEISLRAVRGDGSRLHPEGVAFDVATNTLVVASPTARSVILLGLDGDHRVEWRRTVRLERRPTAVAAAPGAVLVATDRDDVIALDAWTGEITAHATVGHHPRGVAAAGCAAAVTSREDDTLTLLKTPCTALRLTALDPAAVPAGGPAVIGLAGTGFAPGAVVNVNDARLAPDTVTPTRITVTVPAEQLSVPGTVSVSVTIGDRTSNALPLTVGAVAAPALAGLLPASGQARFLDLPLTAFGSGFLPGATLEFDGSRLPTVVDGPTQARATVPGALLADGRVVDVAVINPGGIRSGALPFTVANPVPVLSSVTPNNVAAGSGDTEVVLLGTDFVLGSKAYFCPSATSLLEACTLLPSTPFVENPPVQINARIPGAQLVTAGDFAVRVLNPEPGGGESFSQPFTVTTSALPPGYTVTVLAVPAGHPERVALAGPAFAAAVVPNQGVVQFVDLAPASRGLAGQLTLTGPTPSGLLGDIDGDPATGTLVVSVPFQGRVDVVRADRGNPAASAVTPLPLPSGAFPFGVAINPRTGQAIVTDILGLSALVVDLATGRVVATIALPGAGSPTFVAVNPATNVAAVVDQGDFSSPGRVYLVDLGRRRVTGTVTVGVGPTFAAVNPRTNRLVVANAMDDTVSIVDLAGRGALVATIPTGEEPAGIAVDPTTDRAMVTHTRGNQIVLLDLAAPAVGEVLQIGAGGAVAPSDVAWDPASRVAVATTAAVGPSTNNLIVVDLP
jgi:YVTN family beta-propeller protein